MIMKRNKRMILCVAFSAIIFMATAVSAFAVNTEKSTVKEGEKVLNVTVKIPLTDQEPDNTVEVFGKSAGTEIITGDEKDGDDDKEYNYSVYKIIKQASIKIMTSNVNFINTFGIDEEYDLDHVISSVVPNKNNTLSFPSGDSEFDVPEDTSGYDYIYIGEGNISRYFPNFLRQYSIPSDQGPVYTTENGVKLYFNNGYVCTEKVYSGKHYYENFLNDEVKVPSRNSYYVHGLYLDGERKFKDTWFNVRYDSAQQFNMAKLDESNEKGYGDVVATTYCCENGTNSHAGFLYSINNLEEADYYTDKEAEMIRSIAFNGYWGDENFGSIDDVKNMMKKVKDKDGEKMFTDDDIDMVTDGIALTATQMAIWTFSNAEEGLTFLNASHTTQTEDLKFKSRKDGQYNSDYSEIDLIFKLYNYLVNLEPTKIDTADTSNTVINEDNFLEDLTMTIKSKTGDEYITDFNIKPSVKIKENNGDNLAIAFYGENDSDPLFIGRIAGSLQPGEKRMKVNDEGYYTLEDIAITEGEQIMAIEYKGVQKLDKGVYLFKSEIREGNPATSQTMVGIAEGDKKVNIAMQLGFTFNAEDEYYEESKIWSEPSDSDDPATGDVYRVWLVTIMAIMIMIMSSIIISRRWI